MQNQTQTYGPSAFANAMTEVLKKLQPEVDCIRWPLAQLLRVRATDDCHILPL